MSFTKYELKEIIMESMYEVFMENSKYKRKHLSNIADAQTNKPLVDWMKKYGLWVDSNTPARCNIAGWNADYSYSLFNSLWSVNYNPSDSTITVDADGKKEKIKLFLVEKVGNPENTNGFQNVKTISSSVNSDDFINFYSYNYYAKIIKISNTVFKELENELTKKIKTFKDDNSIMGILNKVQIPKIEKLRHDLADEYKSLFDEMHKELKPIYDDMYYEINLIVKNSIICHCDQIKKTLEYFKLILTSCVEALQSYVKKDRHIKFINNSIDPILDKIERRKANAESFIMINLTDYKHFVDKKIFDKKHFNIIMTHEAAHIYDHKKTISTSERDKKFVQDCFQNYFTDKSKKSLDLNEFLIPIESPRKYYARQNLSDAQKQILDNSGVSEHDLYAFEVFADRFAASFSTQRNSDVGRNDLEFEDKLKKSSNKKVKSAMRSMDYAAYNVKSIREKNINELNGEEFDDIKYTRGMVNRMNEKLLSKRKKLSEEYAKNKDIKTKNEIDKINLEIKNNNNSDKLLYDIIKQKYSSHSNKK